VSEPVGAETLRLFAATGPIPGFPTSFGLGFPTLSTNPIAFVNTVLATMQSTFAAGDRAVGSVSLTVQPAPLATGTLRVLSTPAGASVRLDGVSIGTTNLERPNVSPGLHTVEVSRSGYQTETRQATITAGSTTTVQVTLTLTPVNQAPVAAFTYSPTSPGVGTPVQFDASPSADPDGTIISYAWNFGDGGTAVGPLVSHAYAASGSYTVQLAVTDNGGATAQVSRSVGVVSSDDVGWVSPVGYEDPGDAWTNEKLAYDRDLERGASATIAGNAWSSFLIFALPEHGLLADRIRFRINDSLNYATIFEWDVDVEVGGEWIAVYEGSPEDHTWFAVSFPTATVTRVRIRTHNLISIVRFPDVMEIQLHDASFTGP
jgi:PKD repeat protein